MIVGGIYISNNAKNDAMMAKEQMEQKAMEEQKMAEEKAMMEKRAMEEKDAMMKADNTETDSMMKKDETSMMDKSDTMMKIGSYETYAPEKVALASATHDVVLFFRASWCPTCRALDADIKANLSKIPESLAILDMNYDNSIALKQKYTLDAHLPSMRAVGYRQVWEYLAGVLPEQELRDRIIFATRQYAKRQLTWLKSWPDVELFDINESAQLAKQIHNILS